LELSLYCTSNDINCLYTNIRGLATGRQNKRKINVLSDISLSEDIQMMIMVESHMKEDVKDEELHVPGFKIYRCDRKDREQGGVIIYVRDYFEVTETTKFSNGTCELLTIKLPQLNYHVVCLYRPPNTQSEKLSEALKLIDDYIKQCGSEEEILFLGRYELSVFTMEIS
jgi:exonuclease III